MQALQLLVLLTCITAAKAQNNVNYYDINALFGNAHKALMLLKRLARSAHNRLCISKADIASGLACQLFRLHRALRMYAMCQGAYGLKDCMQLRWLQAP